MCTAAINTPNIPHTMDTKQDLAPRDAYGFLLHIENWRPEWALEIALEQNIDLNSDSSKEYWTIIYWVRDFFLANQHFPSMRMLIQGLQKEFQNPDISSLWLQKRFPTGIAKTLSLLAGLPKPLRCI
ncbi:MAG: TusE/DsrC/DsvC family sulfur relay protein [Gammaproteobacteria bacterium]